MDRVRQSANFSETMSLNVHQISVGLVNCIYVNHEVGKFWVVDYRVYDPDRDGKTKIEHVEEMLQNLIHHKALPFQSVLMDSWYATNKLMLYIDSLGKYYYCPLKRNRRISLSNWSNNLSN